MTKLPTKEELKKLIDDNFVMVRHNDNWKYPQTGDDQKTCPMLDFMFQVEYKGGYLIFIPNKKEVKQNEENFD